MKRKKLKIDPDFKKLTSPLDAKQYDELEQFLINRQGIYPVYTWNGYVLYDHTCYEIYRKHRMRFTTVEVELNSKNEAISWICERILEGVDLPILYRKFIIGKKYMAEAAEGIDSAFLAERYKDIDYQKAFHYGKLAVLMSKRYNIGPSAVKYSFFFAKGLEKLNEINTKYVNSILNGNIKVSMESIIAFATLPDDEVKEKASYFLRTQNITKYDKKPDKKAMAINRTSKVTVKDMPVYDPDSYVSSLSLTIPSWICSIKRTGENSNAENISVQARSNLINALTDLITISSIAKEALEA